MQDQYKVTFPFAWDVPLEIRRHVAEVPGQQRAIFHDGHLLLLLHAVPQDGELWRRSVRLFWRNPDGDWRSSDNGAGADAIGRHVEQYASAVQEIENQVEQASTARQCHLIRRRLGPLHRASHNLHAALLEAHQFCLEDETLNVCRNVAANAQRATELLSEDVRNTFDYSIARQHEQQTRTAHRMSLLTATFFPILTFAAVFGMNITCGLESQSPLLFWAMMGGGCWLGYYVRNLVTTAEPSVLEA